MCRSLPPETRNEPAGKQATHYLPPNQVTLGDVPLQVMRNLGNSGLVPLGRGIPNPDLLPIDKLNRMLATEARRFRIQSVSYAGAKGSSRLRTQIARRSLNSGCALSPDEIVITSRMH